MADTTQSAKFGNPREQLEACEDWLGDQHEALSDGLRSPEDALKLWRYALAHDDLDEYADTWAAKDRKAALGYDPLK